MNNQSLVDVSGPIIEAVRPYGRVVDGVELVLFPDPEIVRSTASPTPRTSHG